MINKRKSNNIYFGGAMWKILNKIKLEIYEYLETVASIFPGYSGRILRCFFYKITLGGLGCKPNIAIRCRLQSPANIKIGDDCQINTGCILAANSSAGGGIEIGNDVLIGPQVMIHSGNHKFDRIDLPISEQGHSFKSVEVCDGAWIGAKVIVLSGVTIGRGCVIAAGSVVTKDTDELCVYAGVPARKIKSRK